MSIFGPCLTTDNRNLRYHIWHCLEAEMGLLWLTLMVLFSFNMFNWEENTEHILWRSLRPHTPFLILEIGDKVQKDWEKGALKGLDYFVQYFVLSKTNRRPCPRSREEELAQTSPKDNDSLALAIEFKAVWVSE